MFLHLRFVICRLSHKCPLLNFSTNFDAIWQVHHLCIKFRDTLCQMGFHDPNPEEEKIF